ncbi:MAG: hypothetical protein AAF741_13505 [Bacteroidota bacterium]
MEELMIKGRRFYKISDVDKMRPFFMSIVSDSNHWLFISSTGGLTAGRKNAQFALFPYYTDDKIQESVETTGSKTIIRATTGGQTHVWEPFSIRSRDRFSLTRNLYKSAYGNQVIFEEHNHDLNLTFKYQWSSSQKYGFIRQATLANEVDQPIEIEMLDGLQNVMPHGVPSDLQQASSNLVDAYKRTEIHESTGLAMYALSAIIVDKAEPSEALKTNVIWSFGDLKGKPLLSSLQLDAFRNGQSTVREVDIKGERGAYFNAGEFELKGSESKSWSQVANVNLDRSAVADLIHAISHRGGLVKDIEADIERGTDRLIELVASADGLQLTNDHLRDSRHFSNVLFNIMRGGIFDDNYQIRRADFLEYLKNANHQLAEELRPELHAMPDRFSLTKLMDLNERIGNPDLDRLASEYLPLFFSRRHGDPSRPWNKFSINTQSELDGSKVLDYQGNWRDIFQNWEALAHAYPQFIEGMIYRFLNASTFDGYNPYRVTKDGFDWETIEPDDPWSYIGYWGDHQIIYLLKFLEFIENHQPGRLLELLDREIFVYANVPYRIKDYTSILDNPKDTIDFDHNSDQEIRARRKELGADGALLQNEKGAIHHVGFLEKILASLLAKISNFIPEGGIWMNTQRPEWNDANNALVGNGVSMVTLYYMRRYLAFFQSLLRPEEINVSLSTELIQYLEEIIEVLEGDRPVQSKKINDQQRKKITDGLGIAAANYRSRIYDHGFTGDKKQVPIRIFSELIEVTIAHYDHTIEANKRPDQLYHAYNLMTSESSGISVFYLTEMLEGQVAVLSAESLNARQVLSVLDGMKSSRLFRPDQYSYILYPNKKLPGFLEKNNIPENSVNSSALLTKLLENGNRQIISRDISGHYHFNGNFKNAADLKSAFGELGEKYNKLNSHNERELILGIFEEVFNHKEFTGRSGTFYGYEGLGSIYWHMVSKLRLAVQECVLRAMDEGADDATIGRLLDHYYEIRAGIGVHKSPQLYGAFPIDPYSHTPAGKGAQQPGMTGQVKEDILSRFGELGVQVMDGQLSFRPRLLQKSEFLESPAVYKYIDVDGNAQSLELPEHALGFTYCQVPVVYRMADRAKLEVETTAGTHELSHTMLGIDLSESVFGRTAEILKINADIPKAWLK